MKRAFIKKFTGILLCLSIIHGVLPFAPAQTRKRTTTTPKTDQPVSNKQAPQKCSGGWSGFINFTKTLNESSDTTQKNRTVGTTRNVTSRNYKYTGRITVNGSQNPDQPLTKVQTSLTDEDRRFKRFVQQDTCFYDGKGVRDQWSETVDNDILNAFGEGAAENFNLNFNPYDGTYGFSFQFPEMSGTINREDKITRGGWCGAKNNESSDNSKTEPAKVEAVSEVIEYQKIDPKNPDVLAGSKTWDTSSADVKSFKYTVTWSFRRCPAPLELEAVEFDEHPYPRWDEWRKVDGETVDGNIVRVRARVTNYSNETKFPQLKFTEQRAGAELPDSERNISIAPGESREVEYLWDTSGWSWEIGGIPASGREVKVEMTEPTAPPKSLSADVLIIPRPVILAHGLWADYTSWDGYDKFFKNAHSSSWSSYAVGADPQNGVMNTGTKGTWKPSNTIDQNAIELNKQIEAVRRNKNAWHVDAVVHSMGGIIARHYIHFLMETPPDGKPALTRLVLLGTPNMGSPCANLMGFAFWSLGKPVTSLEQLRPAFMERFNKAVRNRKGTRFSVLVGNPLPQTCQSAVWGDGVVELPSAIWEINDYRYARSVHTDLTSKENFEYFVWRRLAVSWRGDHKPDNNYRANYENFDNRNSNPMQLVNAAFNRNENFEDEKPALPENLKMDLAKEVVLPAKQSAEIEIPVTANANSGVTFMAAPTVSAVLINDKGAVVGKSLAGTAQAKFDFRSIPIENAPANGVWKLRLENTGTAETSVVVSVWTDSSANRVRFGIEAGAPNAAGQVPLVAKLSENNAPVIGATVKARILSDEAKTSEIALFDDGKSGDGAANDGVYGALTEKLANGDYSVTAKAETNSQVLVAAAGLTIGAAKPPVSVKTKGK
ncbi:MAG TPA: choice-of-anchor X domain-containing protein [Pyrinomonadaceae bacterium]|nr:choice-of-anchor X domain-containing protein [Pyrinomonadaceae bacterium]